MGPPRKTKNLWTLITGEKCAAPGGLPKIKGLSGDLSQGHPAIKGGGIWAVDSFLQQGEALCKAFGMTAVLLMVCECGHLFPGADCIAGRSPHSPWSHYLGRPRAPSCRFTETR